MGCEDANDLVNAKELRSKTSSTNWIILYNMADWFYTQGDAVFRGSFSKSIATSQYLKLYEGSRVIVLVLEPHYLLERSTNIYFVCVEYLVWSKPGLTWHLWPKEKFGAAGPGGNGSAPNVNPDL